LSKLSYDSPGADVAEFLELHVEGTVESAGQRATLGDCGLDHIGLLNGGDANCASYRQIPLATQIVPADRYFVMCSSDAQAALGTSCDFTSWGTSRLANGWLQNGPSDVIALIGPQSTHYAYEGVPAQCGDASWLDLPADTGVAIDGVDDVIAACGEDHLRLSAIQAPLRAPAQCPVAAQPDAGSVGSSGNPSGSTASGETSTTTTGSSPGTDLSGATPASGGHVDLLDASVTGPNRIALDPEAAAPPPLWNTYGSTTDASVITPAAPPSVASCQLSTSPSPHPQGASVVGLTLAALVVARRRTPAAAG
jgi:hypothetical protein